MLQADHVVVAVAREPHAEAVRRLAGLAVPDVVGEDDEVPGNVERLARAEEDVGEDRVEQRVGAAQRLKDESMYKEFASLVRSAKFRFCP